MSAGFSQRSCVGLVDHGEGRVEVIHVEEQLVARAGTGLDSAQRSRRVFGRDAEFGGPRVETNHRGWADMPTRCLHDSDRASDHTHVIDSAYRHGSAPP